MKACRKCGVTFPLENFGVQSRNRDGLYDWCKPCKRAYDREHFARNPKRRETIYAQNVKYRRENRQFTIDYLRAHPCVDCGEQDPRVLQFDHRDPAVKSKAVAVMMNGAREKLIDEIAKCDVRCANCHARRTADQFGWYADLDL